MRGSAASRTGSCCLGPQAVRWSLDCSARGLWWPPVASSGLLWPPGASLGDCPGDSSGGSPGSLPKCPRAAREEKVRLLLYSFYSRETIWAGLQNEGGGLLWAPCGLLWPEWHNQISNSAARPQGARARRTITIAMPQPGRHRTQEEQHVRTRPCGIRIAIAQPGPHRIQEEPHVRTRPCRFTIAIPTSAQERKGVTS